MKIILKYLRQLKMSQQVTIFSCFIMMIVLLMILGICLIQTSILFNIIQTSAEMITAKQERRSIERTSFKIKDYLTRKYNHSVRNVKHIEGFFEEALFISEREYSVSSDLFPSCAKQTGGGKKHKIKYDTNLFCYQSLINSDGITLPSDDSQIDLFNFTVSLLSQYSLLFEVTQETQLFIFDLPKTQMMISYPQNYQANNYSISNRTQFKYYLNELETNPNQSYYYSPVYLSAITNELNMAVFATIPDENGTPMGFTAQSILLGDENIEAIPINIILANNDGEIIFSSMEAIGEATEQIYIFNTTYTGFNEPDWRLIQEYSNHGNLSQYSCNGFKNTFCLYNKYFNKFVQVNALDFEQENFTLIVFVNVTYQTELAQEFSKLTDKLSDSIVQIEWILMSTCLIMLLLSTILIKVLFLPLFKLMMHVRLHLKGLGNNLDRQIFSLARSLNRRSNLFSKLTLRFMTLSETLAKSQITKSELCLQIERFKYNRSSIKDLKNIKQNVANLSEQQESIDQRKVFQSSLNQLYQIY